MPPTDMLILFRLIYQSSLYYLDLFLYIYIYIKLHDGFSFGTVYLCFYDINKTLLVECKFSILLYAWKCMGKVFDYIANNVYFQILLRKTSV